MKNGRVSIIIPVYNTEKYVAKAIESALNQTYSDIEVIAIDDGSTDNSLDTIQNYSNKIRIISNEHRRQPYTLNTGIKTMTGEWFKWLSADDVLISSCIEEQIKEAKNIDNKKNWMLSSNFYTIDANDKLLSEVSTPNFNEMDNFEFKVMLFHHNIISAITLLIHKSTLEEYGVFDENFPVFPDWEMGARFCILHGVRVRLIPKFLTKKRIHAEQVSKTTHKENRPMYHEQLKNHILGKLKSEEKEKFESALSQYSLKIKKLRNEIDNSKKQIVENRKKINQTRSILHKNFFNSRSLNNNSKK